MDLRFREIFLPLHDDWRVVEFRFLMVIIRDSKVPALSSPSPPTHDVMIVGEHPTILMI